MIFGFNARFGRAVDDGAFRWRLPQEHEKAIRDLSWDFAEPDQYPELVGQGKPGLMAAKSEKAFHAAVSSGEPEAILNSAAQDDKYRAVASAIAGLLLLETDLDRGIDLLESAIAAPEDIGTDHFIRKHMPEAGLSIVIAAGLMARLPLQRNSLVLLLAEVYQAQGLVTKALELLAATEQTTHIRLSRTELLYDAGRFDEVLGVTRGVHNDDDFTALMLAYRGRALGELGRYDEAVSVFARALEYPNRAESIKAIALVGRGMINEALGEMILAENDFTQALIEVPDDEEARRHIEDLIRGGRRKEG
jgi:tetratricopeptide (TPR) repeat protein